MDGPVGELIRLQGRHGRRPAHIHFLVRASGHRELVTALYLADDEHIDTDTVFGVSRALVVSAEADAVAPVPGVPAIRYDFVLGRDTGEGTGRRQRRPSSPRLYERLVERVALGSFSRSARRKARLMLHVLESGRACRGLP